MCAFAAGALLWLTRAVCPVLASLEGRVEDIVLPEVVDTIVSGPEWVWKKGLHKCVIASTFP